MDLALEEALRAMARAVEQFRNLGERRMKCLLGEHVSGKLREVATQLEQICDLVWERSSPCPCPRAVRLKEALYGIEDLVNEMEYHRLEFQVETPKKSKVSNPLASALKLGKRFVGSGGDEAPGCRFLKDLDSVASTLGAVLKEARGSNPRLADFHSTSATTAPVQDHKVFGRDKELDDIVKMLTEPLPSGCCHPTTGIISIVGMGGLGKTTLAQSVYNDIRVERHFDLRTWSLASAMSDKLEFAKDILRSANPAYHGFVNKDATFETLQLRLSEFLSSKRLLLVLDDMWDEARDTWQELLISLKSAQSGSRIIVTTRTPKIADMLGTSQAYHLNPMGVEDCWSLFHRYAFGGWSTHDSSDELEQIGRTIVAKVNGLPLAAKVLGGLPQEFLGIRHCL